MELQKEQYEQMKECFSKQRIPEKISNLAVLNAVLYVVENGGKWRGFACHTALNFLAIHQDSCGNLPPLAGKSLTMPAFSVMNTGSKSNQQEVIRLNLFFYDYPFLFFEAGNFCFGFKPFVPIFACYFLVSVLYLRKAFPREAETRGRIGKRLKQLQLKQQWEDGLTKGEKTFILAYPFLLPLYLFQRFSGGGETFLTGLAENYLHYETLLFFFRACSAADVDKMPSPSMKSL